MPLEGVLDIEAERARLRKEIDRLERELSVHEKKLSNEAFVSKARPEAVEKVRAARAETTDRLERLRATLSQIGA